jgi:prepilin-type N-terminal cleavage/methylation domain-containing protein
MPANNAEAQAMRKHKGFTLVELLVVMAIIAILASIVVPNVGRWIGRARMTRALSEIQSIEMAITKMLADADRNSLHDLFNPIAVHQALGITFDSGFNWTGPMTQAQFAAARELYTNVVYSLLRQGRAILTDTSLIPGTSAAYPSVLRTEVIQKLGTSYLPDLARDPWGNLYQIWPGPWPVRNGACIFRTYLVSDQDQQLPGSRASASPDALTIGDNEPPVVDPATDEQLTVGYPAARDRIAFIYSFGANLVSGQAVYRPVNPSNLANQYTGDARAYYVPQDEEFYGGGDDINNWDKTRSWERFYN